MALLQVTDGPDVGRQLPLEGDQIVLGRHPECDIVLDEAAVSRYHARLTRDGESFYIEDLKSRNGTQVNGQAILDRQMLAEGDRINICDQKFAFYINPPSELLGGPAGSSTRSLLLEDDHGEETDEHSTILTSIDISSTHGGSLLASKPEAKLRAMIEIAQNLGRAVSLSAVLPKLLDSLFKVFLQADRGFVILRSGEHGPLVPVAVKYRRPGDDDDARVSKTVVEKAMTTKEAILSADAKSDARFNMAQSIAEFNIRSMMCVPLIGSDGTPLGVIQIDTLDQRSRFTADDLEVLASIGAQAAIAVENAQLHEQALVQQTINRDLELARKVQIGLLPSGPPSINGYKFFDYYEAAYQVGGDYFDYVPLPGDRVGVILADVSGKGVSAALVMAKLSGEVRYWLASESDPARAVQQINAAFSRRGWDDRFVTFVVAVVDTKSNQLAVINAGHMPPLMRHSDGSVDSIGDDEAGTPLGVIDDYPYESFLIDIAPGDSITLFTDGISEAMNPENDLYGLDRLRSALGSNGAGIAEMGNHLLEDVRTFVGGRPQSDDMCVVCFGREA